MIKTIREVEHTTGEADDFSDPFFADGLFDLFWYGDGVGTISIEKSIVDPTDDAFVDTDFKEIQTYDAEADVPGDKPGDEPASAWYRVGFSAYTSGDTTFYFRMRAKGAALSE